MEVPISVESFTRANAGLHHGELFVLPQDPARVYLTTHLHIGRSDLLHYHDEPHLTLILNGGVRDKRSSVDRELFAGELMYFRAGEPHQTISRLFPTKYLSLQFQPEFFASNPRIERNLALSVKRGPTAKFAMLNIYRELKSMDDLTLQSIEMLALGLAEESGSVSERTPPWLETVVTLLNDKWNSKVTLDEIAHAARVHPKTVSRYFPIFFNCTFGQYRRRLRIERALTLMKTTKMSLTEIAYECSFCDQSHFIRAFREMTGISPKHFRRL